MEKRKVTLFIMFIACLFATVTGATGILGLIVPSKIWVAQCVFTVCIVTMFICFLIEWWEVV